MISPHKKQTLGFTLIELLVVISIISLLSSVVLSNMQDARQRAKVTNIVQVFNQIDTAFHAWAFREKRVSWWTYNELGDTSYSNYPNLSDLIEETRLGEFLPAEADTAVNRPFHYSKNGSAEINCSVGIRDGVAITTWTMSEETARAIDELIEDGDGRSCGKFQWTPDQGPDDLDAYYKLPPL